MPTSQRIGRGRARALLGELARFGTVGGLAFVVDVGLFNLLRFGPGEILGHKPLTAKVISVTVAVLVAWQGNRHWTFAGRTNPSRGKELSAFVVVNVGGMAIAVLTLAISHYVLGLTSAMADNIAANVVGLALGTAFRYLAYRYWVFRLPRDRAEINADADARPRPPTSPSAAPGLDPAAPGPR